MNQPYEHMPRHELIAELRRAERWLGTLLDREATDDPTGSLEALRDMVEQAIGRYGEMYDCAPMALVTLDSAGTIQELNETATRLLGACKDHALGQPLRGFVHGPDRRAYADHLARCRAAERRVTTELRLIPRKGEQPLPLELCSVPGTMEPGRCFRTGLVDLSERKRLEADLDSKQREAHAAHEALTEQIRKAAERTDRLRTLAEELTHAEHRERHRIAGLLHDHPQQLLVALKMHATTLAQQIDSDAAAKIADLADQSVRSCRELTHALSPPVVGDGGPAPALRTLVRAMEENHGLTVHLAADEHTDPVRETLRILLFQAAQELLFNLAKHARNKEAWVRLETAEDQHIELTIEDAGPGFDPSTVSDGPGTGFGLPSLRNRVGSLGGSMQIDSAPGHGTRVTMRVAADPGGSALTGSSAGDTADEGDPTPVGGPGPSPTPDLSEPLRILLVDDQALLREGVARVVRDAPDLTVVAEAGTVGEATALAREEAPDVVVVSVPLHETDGADAIRRIRAAAPAARVIGLSASDAPSGAAELVRAGAIANVPKERPVQALLDVIRGRADALRT